jgi:hypothetical protein
MPEGFGHKRHNGSKVHVAVDTLGHLLAAAVMTPASEQERAQVANWPKRCRRSPATTSNWPMWTSANSRKRIGNVV